MPKRAIERQGGNRQKDPEWPLLLVVLPVVASFRAALETIANTFCQTFCTWSATMPWPQQELSARLGDEGN